MLVRVQVPPSAPFIQQEVRQKLLTITSSLIFKVSSCFDMYANNKQRMKNTVISPQVSFEKKFDGPNGPKRESELPPPNAEPRSEPFPCWSIIDPTIKTASITKAILINIIALS